MKRKRYSARQRWGALIMAALLLLVNVPLRTHAESEALPMVVGQTSTVADPDTVQRPADVYGTDTTNAGKVTVGKSVSDSAVTLSYGNKSQVFTPEDDNFVVTVSQTAQVMGLSSETSVPVDVVFVLDASGSMSDELEDMVDAANAAISTLMKANEYNRVSVVAFSGTSGGGTSGGDAANVLSPLAHYDGDGETAHLTLTRGYIYGRGTNANGTRLNRNGTSSGTNIHAGVVVGARQLMDATNITVNVGGVEVTRIPFLVIMSDGQPSYVASGNWYDPNVGTQLGNMSNASGAGFLPALTAAYYKGLITEKYFGSNSSKDNRCFIYTMGLGLTSLSNEQQNLALMTVDPAGATSSNTYYSTFEGFWESYSDGTSDFTLPVRTSGSNGNYTITEESIALTSRYVNGIHEDGSSMGYTGGYKYNDEYFSANQGSDLAAEFQKVIVSIQQQAMAAPTRVDAAFGDEFSGYVTFTDPIGEYMEVKNLYGLLADGNYYRGQTFAQKIMSWGDDAAFVEHFTKVLKERCRITGATIDVDSLIASMQASSNQAYYNGPEDYDNSFVWWGNGYTSAGEEEEQVQYLGFADNDSIEYIEAQKAAGTIPAGADYVCRSYYFYGAAGGTVENPNLEYLHFVVRVQRSLTAPYQQTVVVSAPAALLSMEKVMITQTTDSKGNTTYTAAVTEAEPARVVYEVGLRSDINPFNVAQILEQDEAYLNEEAEFDGVMEKTNYDAAAGTYTFYTNDWNRSESQSSHHRAMTKATFDAAANNPFYTYTEDTPIYTRNGSGSYVLYTGNSKPNGDGYYYAREVYDWTGASKNADGTYNAVLRTEYIPVTIPDSSNAVKQGDSGWYIVKGAYKASSLTGGEDVMKSENRTKTSDVVVHPHRTSDETNSHYTVCLGNNGKLTLTAEETKSVDITKADKTQIVDADGKTVMVGNTLTYTIKVVNGGDTTADATVTDWIPVGTAYVPGSASNGGVFDESANTITWTVKNMPSRTSTTVSFQVVVTEAALSGDLGVVTIKNKAHVVLTNGFEYTTNPVENPPEGKKVVDSEGNPIEGGVEVPEVLVYRIRYYNDTDAAATVTVRDVIPQGTTYVTNSASHGGIYVADAQTITWTIENVEPGVSGVVSFRVNVNASAVEHIENGAVIVIGENAPRYTNTTQVAVVTGDLVLRKTVADNGYPAALNQVFTLNITEIGLGMTGTYPMLKNGQAVDGGITFAAGLAVVEIRHGDVIEIQGIPAGAVISVTETAKTGFTPAYTTGAGSTSETEGRVTIVAEGDVGVSVTNTYAPNAVQFRLQGTKKLDTDLPVEDVTFGFTAYACDANGENIDSTKLLTGEVSVSAASREAVINFSPVTFYTTGTYHYLISEIDGGVKGIGYTQQQYLLTVTVTDDGTGTLKASASLKSRTDANSEFGGSSEYTDTGVAFVNSYEPLATQLVLEGTKTLTGRTLKEGEFSFVAKDASGAVVTTGTQSADGTITFRPITYDTVGAFTYYISEINSGLNGVTYSDVIFTVTVKVEDVQGQLVATATYPNGGVVFSNTYTPKDVSVTLSGTKTLTGRTLPAGEFNVVVEDAAGKVVATGTNDANGRIRFTAIGYTVADVGRHVYTVRELVPDLAVDPNMYYDPATFQVEVTVSYDPQTGILSVTEPVVTNGPIAFTNIQNPNSVEIVPRAAKTTSNAPDGVTFSFSVINTENGNEAATGVGPANGAFNFTVMSYSEPGTYTYWIVESNAGNTTNGITYDLTRYLMKVVVTRNATNKLEAQVTYWASAVDGSDNVADYTVPANEPSFENSYNASGYINITAKKVLNGRDLRDGEFAFKLIRQDNGGEFDGVAAADGTIRFATMYYSLADLNGQDSVVIHYVMTEVIPEAAKQPGMTYDTASYDVYVKLTNDGTGKIIAQLVDANGAPITGNDTGAVFTNTYAPVEGTSAVIEANKILSGRELDAEEFGFQLFHVTDAGERLVATAMNDANGNIVFPTRNYPANILNGAESAVFKYVIREINGGLGGVTYSNAAYWVAVTVVDNQTTGKLECSVKYYADEACTNEITNAADVVFRNTYQAKDTSYTPVASKVLKNRTMADNEFSFLVKSGDALVSTGLSKADGTIVFTPIGYTDEGTYYYSLHEVVGNLTGVAYTDAVYYLKVVVTDDGDGNLVAEAAYYTDSQYTTEAEKVEFTNIYTPANVSVRLSASKILTGRDMTRGEFSFVVTDADGNVVATGGNAQGTEGVSVDVVFSSIGYSLADLGTENTKSFVYKITELVTTQGGVTFADDVYYAKVTLTNNLSAGALETSVKYYTDAACTAEAGKVEFENTYAPTPAELVIPADKTLINKILEAGEFTFTLTDANGRVLQTKTNDAGGVIHFDALVFTTPGTYIYTVSEAVTEAADAQCYTMDHSFVVIVTVTDNLNGQLVATATYHELHDDGSYDESVNLGGVEFINRYTAPALNVPLNTQIGATKTVNTPAGITYSPAGFTFAVTDVTGTMIKGKNDAGEFVDMIGVSDENGNIAFPAFYFEQAGEYHYWIREVDPQKGGITADDTVWEVHILVRYDEATGLLYVRNEDVKTYPIGRAGNEDTVPAFFNIYEADPAKINLLATKLLTGRDLRDREFLFFLLEGDVIAAQGYNDINGNVLFEVTYTEVGTHTYTVMEYIPISGLGGVTYDEKVYGSVTIEVRDNGQGKLVAYLNGEPLTDGTIVDTGVTVENIYEAEGTEAVIYANKVIVGGKPVNAGDYTFLLVNTADPEDIRTAVNDGNGLITFRLDYTKAGVYTYRITEQKGSLPGVTYDDSSYDVTVTVVDDGYGKLRATVTYADHGVPTFVNSYAAASTTAQIKAHKTLIGVKPLAAESYTFELEREDGVIITAANAANGDIVFDLKFDTVGVYTYTLREQKGDEPGTTYDDTEYRITVTVVDNLDGTLTATVKYEGLEEGKIPVFTNSYQGQAVPVRVSVTKALTGKTLADGEFTFTLTNQDDPTEVYTATNTAAGIVEFALTFENPGAYTYLLAETKGSDDNVTYDAAVYKVTITVTDDLQGYLVAQVTYDTTDGAAPVFRNVYTPDPTAIIIEASKKLTGRELKEGEFAFVLLDAAGKEVATAKNSADGKIVFSAIELTAAGTYTFTLAEVKGDVGGVTYDATQYTVTVTVTDDGNGNLSAVVAYEGGSVPVFANSYQAEPTTAQIKAYKTMTGAKPLAAEKYTFELENGDGVVITATNQANGDIVFNLKYDKAGVYTYTLREQKGDEPGTTYDDTEYKITVTVVDNLDGTLTANVKYEGLEEGKIPVFTNSYKGQAVPVQIGATKNLTGKTLADGEFNFTLTNQNEPTEVYTATNDASGNVEFLLTFEDAGTYTYLLAEKAGTDDNITYDANVHVVTITVTDDLQGYMVAQVTYGTTDGAAPVFNNVFTPDTVEVVIEAEKQLTGRNLKDGEFTFELWDAAGELVATAKNDAEGKIVFAAIELTEGEYTFTVSEVKGGDRTVVYDTAKFTVKVEVAYEGEELTAKVTYPTAGAVFKNTYHAPDPSTPVTGDETPVTMLLSLMVLSAAAMISLLVLRRRSAYKG